MEYLDFCFDDTQNADAILADALAQSELARFGGSFEDDPDREFQNPQTALEIIKTGRYGSAHWHFSWLNINGLSLENADILFFGNSLEINVPDYFVLNFYSIKDLHRWAQQINQCWNCDQYSFGIEGASINGSFQHLYFANDKINDAQKDRFFAFSNEITNLRDHFSTLSPSQLEKYNLLIELRHATSTDAFTRWKSNFHKLLIYNTYKEELWHYYEHIEYYFNRFVNGYIHHSSPLRQIPAHLHPAPKPNRPNAEKGRTVIFHNVDFEHLKTALPHILQKSTLEWGDLTFADGSFEMLFARAKHHTKHAVLLTQRADFSLGHLGFADLDWLGLHYLGQGHLFWDRGQVRFDFYEDDLQASISPTDWAYWLGFAKNALQTDVMVEL